MMLGLVWGAPDLRHDGDHQGVDLVKLRRTRITSGLIVLALAASVPLATTALAQPVVVANITGDPVAPGQEATLTFTISPEEGTLASFTLTPPANWQLVSGEGSPSPGGPNYSIDGNTLLGSGLSVTSESPPATVQFRVKTGCKGGNWAWTLDARDSENNQFGNGESDLTTTVSGNCTLAIATQPTDAAKNTLITGTRFDKSSTNFVRVALENALEQTVTYFPVDVTFELATGPGLASGSLSATTKTTEDGIATFSGPAGPPAATLSISNPNDPLGTDFQLKPKTVGTYAGLTGANSAGFDIWEDACRGTGCNVNLRNNNETYTAQGDFGLGASRFTGELVSCPDQRVIFGNTTFFHQTSGTESDVVFLLEHITREDMKAAANNGQKHVGWCVGLETPGVWNFPLQDTNSNGDQDPGEFYVGMAPKCPNKRNASQFAPCILSQMGDNLGGSFIRGYLPGGDPPRRT
jgi:hypothetical protein